MLVKRYLAVIVLTISGVRAEGKCTEPSMGDPSYPEFA
jgi:hypothetical protein